MSNLVLLVDAVPPLVKIRSYSDSSPQNEAYHLARFQVSIALTV